MRNAVRTIIASLVFAASVSSAELTASQQLPPTEILSKAAERGAQLVAALKDYSYYAELTIQTVSQSDTITGKFYRFSQVSFDRDGTRREKILENTSTLPKDV